MAESIEWKVSKDGKTVTAGGKTYSISAFMNQFRNIEGEFWRGRNALDAGAKGTAEPSSTRKIVVIKDDQAAPKRSKREAKRNAKSIAIMNENLQNRKEGGITSPGGKKNVNPIYRNMGTGVGGMFGPLEK